MFSCGAANLFHFKADQPKYSIKPEDYGKKPLFDKFVAMMEKIIMVRMLMKLSLRQFSRTVANRSFNFFESYCRFSRVLVLQYLILIMCIAFLSFCMIELHNFMCNQI
jgi:hypothetical protein